MRPGTQIFWFRRQVFHVSGLLQRRNHELNSEPTVLALVMCPS